MKAGFSRAALILFSVAIGSLAGCSTSTPPTAPAPTTKSDPAVAVPAANVSLNDLDEAKFKTWLEQQKGTVVVIDFWATWCGPCVKLIPHTVEVAHTYRDKGLVTATVSLDDLDNREEVIKFLQSKGADTTNFISTIGGGGGIAEPFEFFAIPDGSIPCFKVYDRQGNLRQTLDAPEEPAFSKLIETLLAE